MLSLLAVAVAAAAAEPVPVGITEWAGTYTCAQGLTHLSLTTSRDGDRLWATFAFGPSPGNPDVPSGSSRMTGTVHGADVDLVPGEWLVRPPNYVTVAVHGGSEPGGALRGTVSGPPGCTTFEARPVRPTANALPTGPSVWEGSYVCRQGRTKLALELYQTPLHELKGTFAFAPGPETPGIPSGRFALSGHVDPVTGGVLVQGLAPGPWLVRPEGWQTVGLRGRASGQAIRGDVVSADVTVPPTADDREASGCTRFEVVSR